MITKNEFGVSPEAGQLHDTVILFESHFERSIYLSKQKTIQELVEIYLDCQLPNWDGYDADPVQLATLLKSRELIVKLPLDFPKPLIGAEPDGHITLEWHKSAYNTLSVSVSPEGILHYSALLGANQKYGKLVEYSEFPQEILRLICEVY